jgi:hypothetical protein
LGGAIQGGTSDNENVSTDSKANGAEPGLDSIFGGLSDGTSKENLDAKASKKPGAQAPAQAQAAKAAPGSSPNAGHSTESKALADKFCQQFPNLQISSGKQEPGCVQTLMGSLPDENHLVSTLIVFPEDGSTFDTASADFTAKIDVENMVLGHFGDAKARYLMEPQVLSADGKIKGHIHITVQRISVNGTEADGVPNPKEFSFFKGADDPPADGRTVEIPVKNLKKPGLYRICTMASSFSHQAIMQSVFSRGSGDDCIRITLTGKDLSGVSDEDVKKAEVPLGQNGEFFPGFGIKGIIGKVLQQKLGGANLAALTGDSTGSAAEDTIEQPAVENADVPESQPEDTPSDSQEASDTATNVLENASEQQTSDEPAVDAKTKQDSPPPKPESALTGSDTVTETTDVSAASTSPLPKTEPVQGADVKSPVEKSTSYENKDTSVSQDLKVATSKEEKADTTKSETLGKVSSTTEDKKPSDSVISSVLPKPEEKKSSLSIGKDVLGASATEANASDEGLPAKSAKEPLPFEENKVIKGKTSYESSAEVKPKSESRGSELPDSKLSKYEASPPKQETKSSAKSIDSSSASLGKGDSVSSSSSSSGKYTAEKGSSFASSGSSASGSAPPAAKLASSSSSGA